MSYVQMSGLTWPDAEALAQQDVIGLIPTGAIEQHGPALPLATDCLIAEELARRIADRIDEPVVVAPSLPGGLSTHHIAFPGTVTLPEPIFEGVIDAYVEAFERQDIDDVVSMLTEDAVFSMPPMATWYGGPGGPEEMKAFMEYGPLSGEWDWYPVLTTANGQPALGYYAWLESENAYLPFALNILSFRGDKISDVTCYICRSTTSDDPGSYARFPEEPVDARAYEYYFGRFGLPPRISREDAV
jgi:hypothetical protein